MKEIGSKSTIISTCLVTVYMLVRGASRQHVASLRDLGDQPDTRQSQHEDRNIGT